MCEFGTVIFPTKKSDAPSFKEDHWLPSTYSHSI